MELPEFETKDMHGARFDRERLLVMAPVLIVLLRGFA
jgi:hypothetical protein